MINNIISYNKSVSENLEDKFDAIFPTWPTVVTTILAVMILLLVLTKLFYNPVKKMVEERKKFIQNNIDSAIKQNEASINEHKKALQEITEAQIIASNIVADAKLKAEKIFNDNITNAKEEAKRIVKSAHKEVIREKQLFEIQAKEEMVTIALEAAKNVIKKEVDVNFNHKIIRDFIKDKYTKEKSND